MQNCDQYDCFDVKKKKKILSMEQRVKKEVTKIYQLSFLELPFYKRAILKNFSYLLLKNV